MITFAMIVIQELIHGISQGVFAEEDQPRQTVFFKGANEAFRIGVQFGLLAGKWTTSALAPLSRSRNASLYFASRSIKR
jgi:hypothetical protein